MLEKKFLKIVRTGTRISDQKFILNWSTQNGVF